jgi:Formamidopyrimidine-DNA glycosylase
VAGVGNIYATEALFRAGIRPSRPGRATAPARLRRLAGAVREVLLDALAAGGTTLRDFRVPDGRPGYFEVELDVYGRAGRPCHRCGGILRATRIAGRSTVWCPRCQR